MFDVLDLCRLMKRSVKAEQVSLSCQRSNWKIYWSRKHLQCFIREQTLFWTFRLEGERKKKKVNNLVKNQRGALRLYELVGWVVEPTRWCQSGRWRRRKRKKGENEEREKQRERGENERERERSDNQDQFQAEPRPHPKKDGEGG